MDSVHNEQNKRLASIPARTRDCSKGGHSAPKLGHRRSTPVDGQQAGQTVQGKDSLFLLDVQT